MCVHSPLRTDTAEREAMMAVHTRFGMFMRLLLSDLNHHDEQKILPELLNCSPEQVCDDA